MRKRLFRIVPLFVFVLTLTFYVEPSLSNAVLLPTILTMLYHGGLPGYFASAIRSTRWCIALWAMVRTRDLPGDLGGFGE